MKDLAIQARARSPGLIRMALALAVLVLAAGPAWSEHIGRCATVELPCPVILPDGSTHEAEEMSLCVRHRGPTAGYHEIRIDGMTHSMLQSRISKSEGPAVQHPVVVFQPRSDGKWVLIGYAWPNGDRMRNYALHSVPGAQRRLVARNTPPLDLWGDHDYILLAANLGGR